MDLELAPFTRRYQPAAQRFYERKRAQRNGFVAVRALAHKLARACYFMLRDQVPYEPARICGYRRVGSYATIRGAGVQPSI